MPAGWSCRAASPATTSCRSCRAPSWQRSDVRADTVSDVSEGEDEVWLVRHGETEWSKSGQHTGTTDLPLTDVGVAAARALKPLIPSSTFDLVLCSPRERALHTAQLAGLEDFHIEDGLVEWN